MNLPNKLTILRIVLTFLFMFLLFLNGLSAKIFALVVFVLASITDFLDGYIARKYNLITDLGKFLDPVADKVLVLAAFLAFVEMGMIPAWMVVIIIMRELLITGIRILSAGKGKILAASAAGKNKTISQMISISLILCVIVAKEAGSGMFTFWNPNLEEWTGLVIYIVMLITVILTLVSGFIYVFRNRGIIFGAKNH